MAKGKKTKHQNNSYMVDDGGKYRVHQSTHKSKSERKYKRIEDKLKSNQRLNRNDFDELLDI